ncbi:MAG: MarR family winged helix-turn-helix transcriptional regulator [bacterium]
MHGSLGRLLSILHRQAQVYINYVLKELNITAAEYAFLLCLYKKDGMTQEDLSTYLYIDKSATTRAIKSLEEKGYVFKNKDNADKRFNRIYLTPKAKEYKDEIRQKVRRWVEFLTEGLDKETVNVVISVLERMVDKVEQTDLKKAMEEL